MTYRIRLSHVRGTVRGTVQLTVRTLASAIALAEAEGKRIGRGWVLEVLDSEGNPQWRIVT